MVRVLRQPDSSLRLSALALASALRTSLVGGSVSVGGGVTSVGGGVTSVGGGVTVGGGVIVGGGVTAGGGVTSVGGGVTLGQISHSGSHGSTSLPHGSF